MPDLQRLAALPLFDNSLLAWSIAGAIALGVFFVLLIVRRAVRNYLRKARTTPQTEFLEIPVQVLSRTTAAFFFVLAIYLSVQALTIAPGTQRILQSAITIALFWQAGLWAVEAVAAWLERKRRRSMTTDRAAVGSIGIIGFILNVVIWALALLLTLDNLGVDITALVAGLGIGGIAVALAVQNVLGDLFASLSITLDRPFVVGDFLAVGDFLGSVEYIGIKSTRLRSLSGEQIIMSNSDLLSSRVRNYGRMSERRVVFGTRIAYETPIELIERVPALIREIVEAQEGTRFDRSHFAKHATTSLDFETVYLVLSADFNRYMDIQQAINLRLHRELVALGIEFACPTQRVIIAAAAPQDSLQGNSMVRLSTVVAAFVLAWSAPALLAIAPAAEAAEQANKITTRAVAEPIKKAQQAMSRQQWDTALAEIEKAQAVGSKTPFEAYQLDEFFGYVLLQQKKFAAAAPVFERTLNSGFLPAEKVDDRTRTVAQLYFTLRDYRKAAEWSKKWRDKYPNELEAAVLLGQSYYLLNDFKNAAATMTGAVDQAERAGQKPKEDWLKIILTSQFRLDNRDGRAQALKKMVRHYPKTEYWANLLDLYRHGDASDRITLGYYRLMNEVGVLKDQADYMEMAQLAMDAGVSGEARQIVERGLQNGTLKSSNETEQGRYDRLLAAARKQAAAGAASLAQLAQETEKTTVGKADVALGQAYLSYGKYDEAIAALQRGIGKGGVTDLDEARISLGIAHLKKGQKDLASRAFKAVPNGSEWQELAELWQIRVATANGA